MKISKLIEELESIRNEHGDMEVRNLKHSLGTLTWKKISPEVLTHDSAMEDHYINHDDIEIEIGDKFVWL